MRKFYPLYAAAVLAAMTWACYFGWSWADVDEIKSVPKSVRDNPGAYRAHYRLHTRYYGGK